MNDTHMMILELAGKNYSCAQMVLIGGLRLMSRENPDLVRAMAGLAQGIAGSGNICGAFAGGACLLAMHTAKGRDDEQPHERAAVLQDELLNAFREECCGGGSTHCDALLGQDGGPRAMNAGRCAGLVAWVWERSLTLLAEYGLDPTEGRPLE